MKPISNELLGFYVEHAAEMDRLSDVFGRKKFSRLLRSDLEKQLSGKDAVAIVELVTRFGGYSDHKEHDRQRKAVSKLFQMDGARLSRGKRAAPELSEFVENIAPLLMHYGIPFAVGERSTLVTLLRRIADEVNVRGDPRDELRRVNKALKEQRQAFRNAVHEAISKGLEPLRRLGTQPPP